MQNNCSLNKQMKDEVAHFFNRTALLKRIFGETELRNYSGRARNRCIFNGAECAGMYGDALNASRCTKLHLDLGTACTVQE